eukprot:1122086_1
MATVSVWNFLLLILCPFTLTFGCYYRNLTFHESTTLEPPGFDNCIIDSCAFSAIHGNGLNIKAVRNLTIKNSIFYNISGNAIHFKTDFEQCGGKWNLDALNETTPTTIVEKTKKKP